MQKWLYLFLSLDKRNSCVSAHMICSNHILILFLIFEIQVCCTYFSFGKPAILFLYWNIYKCSSQLQEFSITFVSAQHQQKIHPIILFSHTLIVFHNLCLFSTPYYTQITPYYTQITQTMMVRKGLRNLYYFIPQKPNSVIKGTKGNIFSPIECILQFTHFLKKSLCLDLSNILSDQKFRKCGLYLISTK